MAQNSREFPSTFSYRSLVNTQDSINVETRDNVFSNGSGDLHAIPSTRMHMPVNKTAPRFVPQNSTLVPKINTFLISGFHMKN